MAISYIYSSAGHCIHSILQTVPHKAPQAQIDWDVSRTHAQWQSLAQNQKGSATCLTWLFTIHCITLLTRWKDVFVFFVVFLHVVPYLSCPFGHKNHICFLDCLSRTFCLSLSFSIPLCVSVWTTYVYTHVQNRLQTCQPLWGINVKY